jgi:hypothetical protein
MMARQKPITDMLLKPLSPIINGRKIMSTETAVIPHQTIEVMRGGLGGFIYAPFDYYLAAKCEARRLSVPRMESTGRRARPSGITGQLLTYKLPIKISAISIYSCHFNARGH